MKVISRYINLRFLSFFLFSLIGVLILFVIVDLVENLDRFIDAKAPGNVIILYYIYYIPYILALTMPAATLLASVFSVGSLARNNELVATKALGYSFYQLLGNLLLMGLCASVLSFSMAEGLVSRTNKRKEVIKKKYLEHRTEGAMSKFMNLIIQDPPDKIVSMEWYGVTEKTAYRVKIESFKESVLVSRIDSPSMKWSGSGWTVISGYRRFFDGAKERAEIIKKPFAIGLRFTPDQLLMAQIKPEEMHIVELNRFIKRLRESRGDAKRWMTDLYFRISFPLSNVIIVFLSVPLVYNLRKRSLAIGFGISLAVCFLFFGIVKLGETLGHNAAMHPLIAAWMGNTVAGILGTVNMGHVRK
jgi:lipopolysaccharide export system permease protein